MCTGYLPVIQIAACQPTVHYNTLSMPASTQVHTVKPGQQSTEAIRVFCDTANLQYNTPREGDERADER